MLRQDREAEKAAETLENELLEARKRELETPAFGHMDLAPPEPRRIRNERSATG